MTVLALHAGDRRALSVDAAHECALRGLPATHQCIADAANAAKVERALRIRAVENTLYQLFGRGKLHGTIHTCIGQEFFGVIPGKYLRDGDFIPSNHRCHEHIIAATGNWRGLVEEIIGNRDGVCAGIGISQHLWAPNFMSNGQQGGLLGEAKESDGLEPELRGYLAKLLGGPIKPHQPITLRSVHRAALASWSRRRGMPVQASLLGSGKPFTTRELLQGSGGEAEQAETALHSEKVGIAEPDGGQLAGAVTGIGIDIEDIDALPPAEDYREHAFYKDHFAPGEMAYCLAQADVPAVFRGTWAAKEAVLKAGLAWENALHPNRIVITRDPAGKPGYPRSHLSVSHARGQAVAVCVGLPASAPALARASRGEAGQKPIHAAVEQAPPRSSLKARVPFFALVAVMVVLSTLALAAFTL